MNTYLTKTNSKNGSKILVKAESIKLFLDIIERKFHDNEFDNDFLDMTLKT